MSQLRKSTLFKPLLAGVSLLSAVVAYATFFNPDLGGEEDRYKIKVTSIKLADGLSGDNFTVEGNDVTVYIGDGQETTIDLEIEIEGEEKTGTTGNGDPIITDLSTDDLLTYFKVSGDGICSEITTGAPASATISVPVKFEDLDSCSAGGSCGSQQGTVTIEGDYGSEDIGSASLTINFEAKCGEKDGLGSVRYSLDLGRGQNGRGKGSLVLYAKEITDDIYTPSALQVGVTDGLSVVRDPSTGDVEEVTTGTLRTEIVAINPYKTEIRQYAINAGPSVLYKKIVISKPSVPAKAVEIAVFPGSSSTAAKTLLYAYDSTSNTWSFNRSGETEERLEIDEDIEAGTRIETRTEWNIGAAQPAQETVELYQLMPGNDLITKRIQVGSPSLTTNYSYHPNSARLHRMNRTDGYWEEWQYDQLGRLTFHYQVHADSAVGDLANAKSTETVRVEGGFPGIDYYTIERIAGQEMGRTYVWRSADKLTTRRERTTVPGAAYGATSNLVTEIERRASDGRVIRELNEAGTETTYSYSQSGGSLVTTATENGAGAQQTVTTTNGAGTVIARSKIDIASGLTLESFTVTATDDLERATAISYGDGTSETFVHGDNCCGGGLESMTDRQGVTTTYIHDAIGRTVETTRLGITERLTYDGANRVIQRERVGSDDSVIDVEEITYDQIGRMLTVTDAMSQTTTTSYAVGSNGTTTTTVYPDGGTRVEEAYSDGQPKEVSGTAAAPVAYTDGTWSGGTWVKESRSSTEWVQTDSDTRGQAVRIVYPDSAEATMAYDALGRLVRETDADGVTTLHEYDGRGRRIRTATDMNANIAVDLGGPDRVTGMAYSVTSAHGTVVERTVTSLYAGGTATATEVSTSDRAVDGRSQWQTTFGQTTSTVSTVPSAGSWTVTTNRADDTQTVQTITNTRPTTVEEKDSNGVTVTSVSMSYDAHGRLATQTDARTGTTTFTYNDADRIVTTSAPDPTGGSSPLVTSYGYDSMGRQTSVTLPDSTVTTTTYDLRGNAITTGGSQTYDVAYTFDAQGRMLSLTTGGQSGPSTTTWTYDGQRGWLTRKEYPDTNGTAYTYTPAGRLASRTWQRGVGTTYTYNAAGDLTLTDYSDATPDVTMTYTRFGALESMADGTGTRTISYTAQLQPESETFLAAFFEDRILTRQYDGLNRPTGFELGTSVDPTPTSQWLTAMTTPVGWPPCRIPATRGPTGSREQRATGFECDRCGIERSLHV